LLIANKHTIDGGIPGINKKQLKPTKILKKNL